MFIMAGVQIGVLAVVCAGFVGQAAGLLNVAGVECGKPLVREGRIKGGKDALPGEFPWLVSIRVTGPGGAHYCGGALIHKKFVLTAAHCVSGRTTKYVAVVAGEHNLRSPGTGNRQVIKVKELISHKEFAKRYINDIALMELSQSVVWGRYVQPICLPEPNADGLTDYNNVTVAGWGNTDEIVNGGRAADVLQKVTVKVLSRGNCQDWYGNYTGKTVVLYDSHVCAGVENGKKDACQGDSGGPLLSESNGRSMGVGVVSAGIGCGRPRVPGLYTRVSRYIDWILTNMRTRGVNV